MCNDERHDVEMIETSFEAEIDRTVEREAYRQFMGEPEFPHDPATDDPESREYKLRHRFLDRKPECEAAEPALDKARRALSPTAEHLLRGGGMPYGGNRKPATLAES